MLLNLYLFTLGKNTKFLKINSALFSATKQQMMLKIDNADQGAFRFIYYFLKILTYLK